jgi:hypothetical protein
MPAAPGARQDRRVAPYRFAFLATLCTLLMCGAGVIAT